MLILEYLGNSLPEFESNFKSQEGLSRPQYSGQFWESKGRGKTFGTRCVSH